MGAAAVVYVHGLWMIGPEALLLRRRLRRERGLRLHTLRYGSVRQRLPQSAAALSALVDQIDAPQVHLLGHSLGGAVILHCLQHRPPARPGRVVLLGSPLLGSQTAQWLARRPLGRRMLGHAAVAALLEPQSCRWQNPRELGIIAGTLPFGFGRLVVRFGEDNDGTVAVSETRLPGAAAHITLPVSHMGLLWSAAVARAIGRFFEHGRFDA